eukprot:191943-Hanusia_phi.AAC.2
MRLRGGGSVPSAKIMPLVGRLVQAPEHICMYSSRVVSVFNIFIDALSTQLYLTNIYKNGPWKQIAVHAWGAFLVGLFTHPGFPKEFVAVYEAAFRTISAIVTVDVYNCMLGGSGARLCSSASESGARRKAAGH